MISTLQLHSCTSKYFAVLPFHLSLRGIEKREKNFKIVSLFSIYTTIYKLIVKTYFPPSKEPISVLNQRCVYYIPSECVY